MKPSQLSLLNEKGTLNVFSDDVLPSSGLAFQRVTVCYTMHFMKIINDCYDEKIFFPAVGLFRDCFGYIALCNAVQSQRCHRSSPKMTTDHFNKNNITS